MSALVIVLIGLAGWEALVRLGGVDELILPAPTQVLDSLWTDRGVLAPDLATTTWEVLAGLAAAIAAGALLGIAMHVSPRARRALRPLVIGSQAVPVPVIAPLVILVLGFGMAPNDCISGRLKIRRKYLPSVVCSPMRANRRALAFVMTDMRPLAKRIISVW